MINNFSYLSDSLFLHQLDLEKIKTKIIKIIVLTKEERAIAEVTGRVTSGSISIDGSSTVRRTASLEFIADTVDYDSMDLKQLFVINRKVSLQIGIKNTLKKEYPQYSDYDYIWFPQGIYVMQSPSFSNSEAGLTISMNLQDKMCLLNGDCGGTFPASVYLDTFDTLDKATGAIITEQITIYQLITELVNHWGGEQLSKIIIDGVPKTAIMGMMWKKKKVTTTTTSEDNNNNNNNTQEKKQGIYFAQNDSHNGIYYLGDTVEKIEDVPTPPAAGYSFSTNGLGNLYFSEGDYIGGLYEDLVYPAEDEENGLKANAGDSITSILDKIKNTLGNFEYFYDIDGNFVFREIQNYLNTSKATGDLNKLLNLEKDAYLSEIGKSNATYVFNNPDLFISYSNSPKWENIKNDFIVWGEAKGTDGTIAPIRYHLAIDTIPANWSDHKYNNFVYDKTNNRLLVSIDYSDYDNFPKIGVNELVYRDVSANKFYQWNPKIKDYVILKDATIVDTITPPNWRDDLYLSGIEGTRSGGDTNNYFIELEEAWPAFYSIENNKYIAKTDVNMYNVKYYLDIIDSNTEVAKYSIDNIGKRTKSYSDSKVNCIFEPDIPDYVLIECNENYTVGEDTQKEIDDYLLTGQRYILVPSSIYKNLSKTSAIWNSAFYAARDLLYQCVSLNESIEIDSIPIYYLEPNIRISVLDKKSEIYGDYIIESYSIPLEAEGTMSISCTRALDTI